MQVSVELSDKRYGWAFFLHLSYYIERLDWGQRSNHRLILEKAGILSHCFSKKSDLVTREIAGETIIVPVRSTVGDLSSIYTLNEVGTTLWELIDGHTSVRQMVENLCTVYEVTPEEAEKDTLDFLASLDGAGLIQEKKGNDGMME
jgi:hypothetical protein